MPTLDEQLTWCREAAELLNKRKKTQKFDDVPKIAGEVRTLLDRLTKDDPSKFPQARVYRELAAYSKRFELLSDQAKTIKDDIAKLGERTAASNLKMVGANLVRLRDTINLGLSEIDPKLAETPAMKELRQAAEQHRPVYEDKRRRIQEAIDELNALVPVPDQQIKALTELRNAGVMLEPNYKDAYAKIKGLTKLLAQGRKSVEEFDRSLRKTGDGKLCHDAIRKATLAIAAFDEAYGVGHADVTQTLERNLANGRAGLKPEVNKTVTDATDKINQVAEDADARRTKLGKEKEVADETLVTCRDALNAYEVVAPIDKVAELLKRFAVAESQVGIQQFAKADEALKEIETEAKEATRILVGEQTAWQQLIGTDLKAAWTKVQSIVETASEKEHPIGLNLARSLNLAIGTRAMGLAGQRRFAEATTVVEPLRGSLDKIVDWAWPGPKGTVVADLTMKDLGGDEEATFRVEMRVLNNRRVGLASDLAGELKRLADGGVARTSLEPALQTSIEQFENDGRALGERIEAAIYTGGKPEEMPAKEWNESLKKLAKGLQDDVQKQLVEAREALQKELDKVQPSDEDVERHKTGQAFEGKRRRWSGIRNTVMQQLDEIGAMLPPNPNGPLAKRRTALVGELENLLVKALGMKVDAYLNLAEGEQQKLVDKINTDLNDVLMPKVRQLRTEAETSLRGERKDKAVLVEEAKLLLKKLEAELKPAKPKKGETKAPWQEYAQTLRMELEAAITMADTDDLTVLKQGMADLRALKVSVGDLLKDGGAGSSVVKRDFGAVDQAKKDLATALETPADVLKQYRPTEIAQLLGEFRSALPGLLKGASPDEAKAEIKKLSDRLATLTLEAGKDETAHQTLYTDAKQDGGKVAEALNQLKTANPPANALFQRLTTRYQAAAPGEMTLDQARLELRDVLMTANAANNDPNARAALETKSGQDKLRQDAEAETVHEHFEAERQIFVKNGMRRAAASYKALSSGERNASLYQQIAVHYKEARQHAKVAGKSTDKQARQDGFGTAQRSLTLAQEAAELFLANSLKATAASRKALKDANARWKIAVGDYVTSVRDLQSKLTELVKADTAATVEQKKLWSDTAVPSLDQLMPLVDGHGFTTDTEALAQPASKKPDELAGRRRAKEAMLLRLAQFERELTAHPVLAVARRYGGAPVRVDGLAAALGGLRSAALAS